MGLAARQDQIFVGRQREMAELKVALDDAMPGQGLIRGRGHRWFLSVGLGPGAQKDARSG